MDKRARSFIFDDSLRHAEENSPLGKSTCTECQKLTSSLYFINIKAPNDQANKSEISVCTDCLPTIPTIYTSPYIRCKCCLKSTYAIDKAEKIERLTLPCCRCFVCCKPSRICPCCKNILCILCRRICQRENCQKWICTRCSFIPNKDVEIHPQLICKGCFIKEEKLRLQQPEFKKEEKEEQFVNFEKLVKSKEILEMKDFVIFHNFDKEKEVVREELKVEDRDSSEVLIDEEEDRFKFIDDNKELMDFLAEYNEMVNGMKQENNVIVAIPDEKVFEGNPDSESEERKKEEKLKLSSISKYLVKIVPDFFMDDIFSYREPEVQYATPLLQILKTHNKDPLEIKACVKYLRKNPPIDFLRLYSLESPFYRNLNWSLANMQWKGYKDLLKTFLFYEKHINPYLPGSVVYRGTTISKEDLKNYYKEGEKYYWPCFSSTSLRQSVAHRFMLMRSHSGIGTIFKIILDPEIKWNKYYMKEYSLYQEEEILLLPYFRFKVGKKIFFMDAHTGQYRAMILLKEVETYFYGHGDNIIQTLEWKLGIIWTDPEVMKPHHAQYRKAFTEKLAEHNVEIDFINSLDITRYKCNTIKSTVFAVISNGYNTKDFAQELAMYTPVLKMCIFTSVAQMEECSQWKNTISKIDLVTHDIQQVFTFIDKLLKELESEKWFRKQRSKPKTLEESIMEILRNKGVENVDKNSMIKRLIQNHAYRTHLSFEYCKINDEESSILAKTFRHDRQITSLHFGNSDQASKWNKITEASGQEWGEIFIENIRMQSLNFNNNPLGDLSANKFSYSLKTHKRLQYLYLNTCSFGASGIINISNGVKMNKSLFSLGLGGNNAGIAGAMALGEAISLNKTLNILDIQNNSINNEGLVHISKGLTCNTKLRNLDLSGNTLTDIQSLTNILESNNSLSNLDIGNNKFGMSGIKLICAMLTKNNGLKQLNLRNCGLGDEEIKELSQALKTNNWLNTIYLSSNNISVNGLNSLIQMAKVNFRLTTCSLIYNSKLFNNQKILDEVTNEFYLFSRELQANSSAYGQSMEPKTLEVGSLEMGTLTCIKQMRANSNEKVFLAVNSSEECWIVYEYQSSENKEDYAKSISKFEFTFEDKYYLLLKDYFSYSYNSITIWSYPKGKRVVDLLKSGVILKRKYKPHYQMMAALLQHKTIKTLYIDDAIMEKGDDTFLLYFAEIKYSQNIVLTNVTFDVEAIDNFGKGLAKTQESIKLEIYESSENLLNGISEGLKQNPMLIFLKMSNMKISNSAIKQLPEALNLNTNLKTLHLEQNNLSEHAIEYIAMGLKLNKGINEIKLINNQITEIGANQIFQSLSQSYLEYITLNLSNNCITEDAGSEMIYCLSKPTLIHTFNIENNQLGDRWVKVIKAIFKTNYVIHELNISNNRLTYEICQDLCEGILSSSSLKYLFIGNNRLGNEGAVQFATIIGQNVQLVGLDLSNNGIQGEGGKELGLSLMRNTHLLELSLNSNLLKESMSTFEESLLNNQTITTLDLSNTGMGDTMGMKLEKALRYQRSLRILKLQNNLLTDSLVGKIIQTVANLQDFKEIYILGNEMGRRTTEALSFLQSKRRNNKIKVDIKSKLLF